MMMVLGLLNVRWSRRLCVFLMTMGVFAAPVTALNTNIAQGKCDPTRSLHYGNPQAAFDGDVSTAANYSADYVFGALTVDFGSNKSLLKSVVNYRWNDAVIQYYKIQGSIDGTAWTDILRVWNPTILVDERMLPAVTYRYVRYIFPLASPQEFGGETKVIIPPVNEIQIFERGAGDPVGEPRIIYPEPFDRTGWSATVRGKEYSKAIDKIDQGYLDPHGAGFFGGTKGDAEPWQDGPQTGDALIVDMKSSKVFDMVSVIYIQHDFKSFSIYVSDDGLNWGAPVYANSQVAGKYAFTFPAQNKRYIKVENDQGFQGFWGFWNVSVYNTANATPLDTGDNVNIALNKTVTGVNNGSVVVDGNFDTKTEMGQLSIDLGASYNLARLYVEQDSYSTGYYAVLSTSTDNISWTEQQYINMDSKALIFANYSTRYLRLSAGMVHSGGAYRWPTYAEIQVFKSAPPGPRPNQPPSVTLISPTANQKYYNAPSTVTIEASVSDDHVVSKVEFFNGNTKLTEDVSAPFTYSWANVPVGTYTVRAIAYDDSSTNNVSTPATASISVNVGAPPAQPVVLGRSNWTVTASDSAYPGYGMFSRPAWAIDGNTTTKWQLGQTPASGANQWYVIDMKANNMVHSINMLTDVTTNADYLKNYEVYISTDSTSWGSSVVSGTGNVADLTITLSTPKEGRYIKIKQVGGSCTCWWGIAELNVTGFSNTRAIRPNLGSAPMHLTTSSGSMTLYSITGRRIQSTNRSSLGVGLVLNKAKTGASSLIRKQMVLR